MQVAGTAPALTDQAAWLQRRQVAYEVGSVSERWDDGARRQGIELRLFAAAPAGADPGSDPADEVWHRLKALALELVPKSVPPTSVAARPYRGGFVFRPEMSLEPELRVALALYPPASPPEGDSLREWRHLLETAARAAGIPPRVSPTT